VPPTVAHHIDITGIAAAAERLYADLKAAINAHGVADVPLQIPSPMADLDAAEDMPPDAAAAIVGERLHADWQAAIAVHAKAVKGMAPGYDKIYPPNLEIIKAAMGRTVALQEKEMARGRCNQVFRSIDGESVFKPFPPPYKNLLQSLGCTGIAFSPTTLASNTMYTYAVSKEVCREMGIPLDMNPFLRPTLCNDGAGIPGIAYPYIFDSHYLSDPPLDALDGAEKRKQFYGEIARKTG
jgi:hypothetical protein